MTLLKSSAAAIAASVTLAIATGHAAEDGRSTNLGPWEIEAIHKIEKIDRCTINRPVQDGIVARFARTDAGLTLELESPNWKLERGKNYAVKMSVGSLSFNAQVVAESVERLRVGRTVLLIAHRPELVQRADRVVVLGDDGTVVREEAV